MTNQVRAALRLSRLVVGTLMAAAGAAAAFLPVPKNSQLASWDGVVLTVAGVVVTIAAIWLGMLFGVALERARSGSQSGASELVLQLLRPLMAGGLTLLGALLLAVLGPYLDPKVLPAPLETIGTRFRVFVSLGLCAGVVYALILSLAPIQHILGLLQSREVEADAQPPAPPVVPYYAETTHREPWQG